MVSSQSPFFEQNVRSFLFFETAPQNNNSVSQVIGKFDIDTTGLLRFDSTTRDSEFRTEILSHVFESRVYLPWISTNNSGDTITTAENSPEIETQNIQQAQYVLIGKKWPGMTPVIDFRINNLGFNDTVSGSIEQQNAAIVNAATTWNVQSGAQMSYQFKGATNISNVTNDGINTILVRNASAPGHRALATAYISFRSNDITDCDIVFWDRDYAFTTESNINAYDIQSVALHELGHCLGLDHSPIPQASMYYSFGSGELRRQLHDDDLAGARRLYKVGEANRWLAAYGYDDTVGGWRTNKHLRLMADVNNDGKDDIVGFSSLGVYVSISNGTGFATPELWVANYGFDESAGGWDAPEYPRIMTDVNGDGKADIVGFGYRGVYVSLSTGSSFTLPERWVDSYGYSAGGWRVGHTPRMLADVNGDGKADVVGFGYSGVYVSLSTGAGFTKPELWVAGYGADADAGGWLVDQNPRMMADVNGDGKADVIGFGNLGVDISLSTGTSFTPAQQWVTNYGYNAGGWRSEHNPRMVADVNGDGMADIIGFGYKHVYVSLSTGSSFTPSESWVDSYGFYAGGWRVNSHPRMIFDVNSDGKADIVGFGYAGAYVSLSNGFSYSRPMLWVSNYGYSAGGWRHDTYPRVMGDVNGDGMADIVGFGHYGTYVSRASSFNIFD